MLGHNLGLHIHKFPSGKWGYVGSVPVSLHKIVLARQSDVLGCRAWEGDDGKLYAYKSPVFDTEQGARGFAESKGYQPLN